jgi:hypothetical protein
VTTPLRTLSELPTGILDCDATELAEALGGPTLVHLDHGHEPALFVSMLLHGNETSGWEGTRRFLQENTALPRSISLFIGNVAAAEQGVRVLPGQRDFNRIWRQTDGAGGALACALEDAISGHDYFAAVDLHNNTGHNPYYSVITDVEPANLGLALMFSNKGVLVEEPDTTLTRWFAGRCPAVALETGPVGDPRCAERVYDFLDRCLAAESISPATAGELDLFRALARVHVRSGVDMSFAGDEHEGALVLTGGVEAVNFHELPTGTAFASTGQSLGSVLQVLDTEHCDVTEEYLENDSGNVRLRRPVVPAMYTTDRAVIDQDCLCYFMERLLE